jgi:hypothetical protein
LLNRTPTWFPTLRGALLVGGLALAVVVAVAPALRGRLAVVVAVAAIVLGLAAPTAYTLSTVAHPHSGSLPTAGPASAIGAGGRGGPGGGRGFGFAGGAPPTGFGTNTGGFTPPAGNFAGAGPGAGGPGGGTGGGGLGGLLNGSTPSAEITSLFDKSTGFRWTAAAIGANNAAGYQLASGRAVMAIGGFNGTDPTPTLAQFEQYVRSGQIHYFIASSGGGRAGGGSASTSSAITQWVEQNFTAQTVGGTTIYDLSS